MTGWKLAILTMILVIGLFWGNLRKIAYWYHLEIGMSSFKSGINELVTPTIQPTGNSATSVNPSLHTAERGENSSEAETKTTTAIDLTTNLTIQRKPQKQTIFFEKAKVHFKESAKWAGKTNYPLLMLGLVYELEDNQNMALPFFTDYLSTTSSGFAIPLRGILNYKGKPDNDPFKDIFVHETPLSPHSAIMAGWIAFHRKDLNLTCNFLLKAKSATNLSSSYHYLKALTQIESKDFTSGFSNLQKARALDSSKNTIKNLGVDIDSFPVTFQIRGNELKIDRGKWIGKLVPYGIKNPRTKLEILYGIALNYSLQKNFHRALFLSEIIEEHYGGNASYAALIPQLEKLSYPLGYNALVTNTCRELMLDPFYVFALIRQESKFQTKATSSKAAQGLMQITPETARWICLRTKRPYREGMLSTPAINISMGCWYVDYLLKKFSHKATRHKWALAAYNAGLGNAERWMKRWKAAGRKGSVVDYITYKETKDYVTRVTNSWHTYKKLYQTSDQ